MVADSSSDTSFSSKSISSSEFQDLLSQAQQRDQAARGRLLQMYVNYLGILATSNLDRRLRRRVSPSDVVQDVMLAAHRDFAAFRGTTQNELLAWLRQILINTLHRTYATHCKARKRDIRREVSYDAVARNMDASATRLVSPVSGDSESPSGSMQAREKAVELANELSRLPPQYRDVIVYRIVQGMSFAEIAERMERSTGAVRMLWLRAIEAFRLNRESREDG